MTLRAYNDMRRSFLCHPCTICMLLGSTRGFPNNPSFAQLSMNTLAAKVREGRSSPLDGTLYVAARVTEIAKHKESSSIRRM